jgi:carboxyl-terminal processing protease
MLGTILAGVFFAGFWLRGEQLTLAAGISPVNNPRALNGSASKYVLLEQTQALLKEHYLRPLPGEKEQEYGAIRGLMGTLNDRFTFFIDPPVAASESNALAGRYGGIGVQVVRRDDGRFELYPFREGPATRAGVRERDILLMVNDNPLPADVKQDAVDQLMRGKVENNNGVKIRVLRPATTEELEFSITFEEIEVPSVVWRTLEQEPTFGYLQILRFTGRTPDELAQAIKELRGQNIRALVLDMRNNPGGLLQESIAVLGSFLDGGTAYVERTKSSESNFDVPKVDVNFYDVPLAVIVNGGTASAAELVAGALQDRKRAILLGQQTYGKGSIQLIFPLADKSSVHITTAEWFTPNSNKLDGKGLTPDVPMIPDQNGGDVELPEAIRRLRDMVK